MPTKVELKCIWLAFVEVKAAADNNFRDLVDREDKKQTKEYTGAWANILLKADTIKQALEILPAGLAEKKMEELFVDKIENVHSLVEDDVITEEFEHEAIWLAESSYLFKIVDPIYPYFKEE